MNVISACPPCLQATSPSTKKRHRGGLEMIHTKQHTHTPCEVGSTPCGCKKAMNMHMYMHACTKYKCSSIWHHGRRLLNLLAIVMVSNLICTDNHRFVSYIFLLLSVYMVPHAEMHCQNCNHWFIPYIQQSTVSYLLAYCPENEACGSTVGTGTALQARRS